MRALRNWFTSSVQVQQASQTQQSILASGSTILVLPSFDLEKCVQETVNRQLARSLGAKDPQAHRQTIMERFPIYRTMGSIQMESNQPPEKMVDDIIRQLPKTSHGS